MPLINLHTPQPKPLLPRLSLIATLPLTREEVQHESHEAQPKRRKQLEQLILDVLVLAECTLSCAALLAEDEEGRAAGDENQGVQEAEGEGFVAVGDDGCKEGGEEGEGCDGELAVLDGFETGRGVGREARVEAEGHGG